MEKQKVLECPECQSSQSRKNGFRQEKQKHNSIPALRRTTAFRRSSSDHRHHVGQASRGTATRCLRPRDPQRWVNLMSEKLLSAPRNKLWGWTAVDHFKRGFLAWVVCDYSATTFEPLWEIVSLWQCYFYVTDGLKIYPSSLPDGDQIVSKTYMTRVEVRNALRRKRLN